MNKTVVIDNYDSFTYNLVHYVEMLTGNEVDVFRNDKIEIAELDKYDKILISPGPGIPEEAGICIDLIRKYASTRSILGVCLGHQAIAEAFGGDLINLKKVYHGIASMVHIKKPDDPLYNGLPPKFEAGRYHSWVVSPDTLPDCFEITCQDEYGIIMGISHIKYDLRGVQFHPESVLTKYGLKIIENWLKA